MRLLECLELGAALDDPGNGRIFCHVDLEANGVVDLGNEANVCQRDAIPDAEFSAGLLQFLLECFLLDVYHRRHHHHHNNHNNNNNNNNNNKSSEINISVLKRRR